MGLPRARCREYGGYLTGVKFTDTAMQAMPRMASSVTGGLRRLAAITASGVPVRLLTGSARPVWPCRTCWVGAATDGVAAA